MDLYFIRHGQTDWNLEGRLQGQTNIELNEEGIQQAKKVALLMKDIHVDQIITSPLTRAKQTAEIINEVLDLEIKVDQRLIERNFGKFEGLLKEEIDFHALFAYDFMSADKSLESTPDFTKRIYAFLDEIKACYKNQTIVIVSHGAVSVPFYYYANGKVYDDQPTSHIAANAIPIHFKL